MPGAAEADSLAFEKQVIDRASTVFDVVVAPGGTPLIRYGREQGKKIITGEEVAALQAVEQFVLYTGKRPSDELIEKAAAHARG